jgi:hypothetical protein
MDPKSALVPVVIERSERLTGVWDPDANERVPDDHEPIGVGIRQRPKQDCRNAGIMTVIS